MTKKGNGSSSLYIFILLLLNTYKDLISTYKKGIQIGEERGIKIGKEEGKIEVVKAMLANNVDVNTIVKFTGLSISEIEELSENL